MLRRSSSMGDGTRVSESAALADWPHLQSVLEGVNFMLKRVRSMREGEVDVVGERVGLRGNGSTTELLKCPREIKLRCD